MEECGIEIEPRSSHRLKGNHRNTRQICKFAAALLEGMEPEDDGTIPDLTSCRRDGPVPIVLKGKYSAQCAYVGNYLSKIWAMDGHSDASVVFLHPKGGGWFDCLRVFLNAHNWPFVVLTRKSEWPRGEEKVALSTMHSAKGLEFDHVIILGLNDEITKAGKEQNDTTFESLRRLLAMSVTRARHSVILGYLPTDPSRLVSLFKEGTYTPEAV